MLTKSFLCVFAFPFRCALGRMLSKAAVAHELRYRLAPAAHPAWSRILAADRRSERDYRTGGALGRHAKDLLGLLLLLLVAEPGGAAAKPEHVRGDQQS